MKAKAIIPLGLFLIIISQLLMSFGYEFLMSQEPFDFAHWALFVGAILLFGLWFQLPENSTKNLGLTIMSFGIGGIAGMCALDFVLWASAANPEIKQGMMEIISTSPSINYPFLIIGPALFYTGICIATYGLFKKFKWQVLVLNGGALMIGLGHMVFENRIIPVIGSILLLLGLLSILRSANDPE